MKKRIFILFGLVLCLLLTSCNGLPAATTGTEASTVGGLTNTTSGDAPSSETTTAAKPIEPFVSYPGYCTVSYDEYLLYITTNEMPEKFVPYESVKGLGPFCGFSTPPKAFGVPDYNFYGCLDVNGVALSLGIYYDRGLPSYYDPIDASLVDLTDMRMLKNSIKDGAYFQDGIVYVYNDGQLQSVEWERDGVFYSISMMGVIWEYFRLMLPEVDKSSICGQLIHNAENAAAIVESIFTPVEE